MVFQIPKSNASLVRWPALPDHAGSLFLTMMRQFEQSERLPADELEALQVPHSRRGPRPRCETVPYYRDRPCYRQVLAVGPLAAAA